MDYRVYISDLKRVYICISGVKEISLALGNIFPLKKKPAPIGSSEHVPLSRMMLQYLIIFSRLGGQGRRESTSYRLLSLELYLRRLRLVTTVNDLDPLDYSPIAFSVDTVLPPCCRFGQRLPLNRRVSYRWRRWRRSSRLMMN